MSEPAVKRFVCLVLYRPSPDQPLGDLNIRRLGRRTLGRWRGPPQQRVYKCPLEGNELAPVLPEQIGMMHQRGEPVDVLAQALVRSEIMDQPSSVGGQQEGVTISRITPGVGESGSNGGKALFRQWGEDEVVRSQA
jgi:hypothetical protein